MRAGSGGRKSPFKYTTTELGRLALLATTTAAEEAAVEEEAERDRGQAAPAPGAAEGRSDGRPEQKLDEAARQLSAEGGGQEAAEGGRAAATADDVEGRGAAGEAAAAVGLCDAGLSEAEEP